MGTLSPWSSVHPSHPADRSLLHRVPHRLGSHLVQQALEVRRPVARDRVPALDGLPRGAGDQRSRQAAVLIGSRAAGRAAVDDVVQGVSARAVDPGVQEPERWQTGGQPRVVEEGDYGGEGGRRGGGAAELEVEFGRPAVLVDDVVPDALGGHVWESSTVGIVQALPRVA